MSNAAETMLVTELNLLTKFWNATEGRDKFSKSIQYGSRLLAHLYAGDKELAARFTNLMKVTGDARKIFRLGKSANEYMKIKELLKSASADQFSTLVNCFCRAAFFGYWVFDNLFILSKIGFIKGDFKAHNKRGAKFWFIGLVLSVFLELYKLNKIFQKEKKIESIEDKNKIAKEKVTIYENVVKNFGDMITASNGAEIPHKILGHGWNEGAIAMGGLTSALITCYQTYPSRK